MLIVRGMLIHAASVGYGREPTFKVNAPGQIPIDVRIRKEIVVRGGALRRAVEAAGGLAAWEADEAREEAKAKAKSKL